jgi:hypothetical protein
MKRQWTEKEVQDWYDKRPWLVGCNFVIRDCVSFFDMWQEYNWEQKLPAIRRELGLAKALGMNTVRVFIDFFVWLRQHDGFMARFEQFLTVLDGYGMTLMPVLHSESSTPKKHFKEPVFGRQPDPTPGFHGGLPPFEPLSPEEEAGSINWAELPEYRDKMDEFLAEMVSVYAKDPRIIIWDLMNEPGNWGNSNQSAGWLAHGFEIVRKQDPSQPVCAGPWSYFGTRADAKDGSQEVQVIAAELSDIINFHCYGGLGDQRHVVNSLKRYNRPLVTTEWLHRPYGSLVETHLPFFKENRIGCYAWGLVAGKTQTWEPWESTKATPGIDLSRWQHDFFHGDYRIYDRTEGEIFQLHTGHDDPSIFEPYRISGIPRV